MITKTIDKIWSSKNYQMADLATNKCPAFYLVMADTHIDIGTAPSSPFLTWSAAKNI